MAENDFAKLSKGALAVPLMAIGLALARSLGVPRPVAILITVGTSICGGSAIAAIATSTPTTSSSSRSVNARRARTSVTATSRRPRRTRIPNPRNP